MDALKNAPNVHIQICIQMERTGGILGDNWLPNGWLVVDLSSFVCR